MFHYVYRISNITLNKHYYGSRTSEQEPNRDLGVIYFSSSSDKNFINDQKKNSEKYTYKVICVCKTRSKAIDLEIKLHNKFDVGVSNNFYNKAKQSSNSFDTSGRTQIRIDDKVVQINSSDYDKENHVHINKNYIVTNEKGRVTRKQYDDENLTHINANMVNVIENGKIIKITKDEYNKGGYTSMQKGKIIVYNSKLGKNETILKEDYDEVIHKSTTKDTVKAYDIISEKCVTVPKEDFDTKDNLVGINSKKITIYDDNDNAVMSKIGKIKDILKENNMPISLYRSNSKEKRYVPNTYHKSKDLVNFLNKFARWYYTLDNVYKPKD